MGGGDEAPAGAQSYLRHVQYRDSSRLAARARLHVKYSTAPVAWFPWVASQVDWPAGAEVLEVGCGAGWMWAEASARLPGDLSLTLSDISPGMAREARGRVGSLGRYRRATAAVADVQQLPFRDGRFDVVVATYVLHHVPNPRRAIAEMARVLRPSGVALVACVGGGHLAELREIREEVFGPAVPAELAWSFDAEAGRAMLPAHFASVEWRPYADQLDCRDPDDVVEYLASTPPVEGAGPEERARVVDAVRARFGRGGGRLRVRKDTGLFVCRGPRPL
ncbi:MAG TPA: class I SAM-dependent methyltransferase [Acidimicrobiales bacterium]